MLLTPAFECQLVDAAIGNGVDRLVVAAVVVRGERVLLLRRKPGDFMGGLYELPSGVVEPGETLAAALHREVAEETGLQVSGVSAYLGHFNYMSGGGRATRQFNFPITVGEFTCISLSEHDAFIWARPHDLERLRITEAVRKVLVHPALVQFSAGTLPG